jgi:hypothetical protein
MGIDDYLDELCAALAVDSLRRDEIRLEVHTHLRQRANALMQKGLPAATAEEWAVEEFGYPEEMALQMSGIPASPAPHDLTPHVERLGNLLVTTGLGHLLLFLFVDDLDSDMLLKADALVLALKAVAFCFCIVHVVLGRALILHHQWARLSAMALGLTYVWAATFTLGRLPEIIGDLSLVTARIMLWILALAGLGLYTFWIFLHPQRRHIRWDLSQRRRA